MARIRSTATAYGCVSRVETHMDTVTCRYTVELNLDRPRSWVTPLHGKTTHAPPESVTLTCNYETWDKARRLVGKTVRAGIELHYADDGSGDGKPVVLLDVSQFNPRPLDSVLDDVRSELAAKGLRVDFEAYERGRRDEAEEEKAGTDTRDV